MAELIPAINVNDFEELKKRIRLVEPYVKQVHVDVADGSFTSNSLWHDPDDLMGFETPLKIEAHLMMTDVSKRIDRWMLPGISRIIFHLESENNPEFLIKYIKSGGKEAGIAVLPKTPWELLERYRNSVNAMLFLAVDPGFSGQKMHENTVEKVQRLRNVCSRCIIGVDGGVNAGTVKKIADAGANYVAAASAIFGARDIKKAIEELETLL